MDGVSTNGRGTQPVLEDRVTLFRGAERTNQEVVQEIFLRELRNPLLEPLGDSALIAAGRRQLAFTTDSFLVDPPFFPGGDIGELAVNGTINDLAMSGARPVALSAALIVEEGIPLGELERIAASMACASLRAGVPIATGDTKLVERGRAAGIFINTSGVGCAEPKLDLSPARIRAGDRVIVSGAIGDHGAAMMLARGELESGDGLRSDTAPLHGLADKLLRATDGVRCLRDPSRGLGKALADLAEAGDVGIGIDLSEVPIRSSVLQASETLGLDPLSLASEGRLVAVVSPEAADTAIAALRHHSLGREAAVIGEVAESGPHGLNGSAGDRVSGRGRLRGEDGAE